MRSHFTDEETETWRAGDTCQITAFKWQDGPVCVLSQDSAGPQETGVSGVRPISALELDNWASAIQLVLCVGQEPAIRPEYKHCCCSVVQLCLTVCDPMDCSMSVPLYFTISWSLLKLMPIDSMMPSNHLILCRPLLLLPSIFPSIRVFSNELALRMRRPKYWSFSISISPSDEYSGLISFRID